MKRLLALTAAVLSLGACAETRLKPGGYKSGLSVVSEGRSPGEGKLARAAALAQAERRAVEGLLPLYAPAQALSGAKDLQEKVLDRASAFVKRRKAGKARAQGGSTALSARVLVDSTKLFKELDALGLVRPEGVAGRPGLVLSLSESGPGGGRGTAAQAMRRVLAQRGYAVGEREERRVELSVVGGVENAASLDPRLTGLFSFKARLSAKVLRGASGEPLGAVEQEASAVDLAAESAAAKALSSVGELAGEAAARLLSSHYRERRELFLIVHGPSRLEQAFSLVDAVRALKPVAAAAFDSLYAGELRLRVYAERLSADELAALLLRERSLGLQVRAVESDYRSVEMELGRPGDLR